MSNTLYAVMDMARMELVPDLDAEGTRFFESERSARVLRDNAGDPAHHDWVVVEISPVGSEEDEVEITSNYGTLGGL